LYGQYTSKHLFHENNFSMARWAIGWDAPGIVCHPDDAIAEHSLVGTDHHSLVVADCVLRGQVPVASDGVRLSRQILTTAQTHGVGGIDG
jgi:hypothetical protein